jgi:hypothetical protein
MRDRRTVEIRFICALLILLSCVSISGCEGCLKDFEFFGMVTDNNYVPLADVQVIVDGRVVAMTDNTGQYAWSALHARGDYTGTVEKFEKAGYQIYEAEPFLGSEAGSEGCGRVGPLRRDAVLQPL